MRRLLLLPLLALALVGCGNNETLDPELTVRTLIEEKAAEENLEGSVQNVGCVKEGDRRWQCIVTVREPGTDDYDVAGTLVCEGGAGSQCIWRGQDVGG